MTLAADRLHLVFSLPNHPGVPVYLHRTAEVSDGTRGIAPRLEPIFDDDLERSQVWTNPEFAVQARDHWRAKGFQVSLFDRQGNGPLFEKRQAGDSLNDRQASHLSRFVPLVGGGVDGLGFNVKFSPERKQWYVRADMVPSMLSEHKDKESLWADTPEGVAKKIIEVWGLKTAVPFADPEAAAREAQELQRVEQEIQNRRLVGIRPGDRR